MKCSKCNRNNFKTIDEFNNHTTNCHKSLDPDVKFTCNICDSQWSCAEVLHYHLYSEHQSGSYVCEICGAILTSKQYVKKHRNNVHLNIRNFQCGTCGKAFTEKKALQKHIDTIHLGVKNIKCEHCDYKCHDNRQMWIHTMTKHTKNPEFKCTYRNCDFIAPVHKRLAKHITQVHAPFKKPILISE